MLLFMVEQQFLTAIHDVMHYTGSGNIMEVRFGMNGKDTQKIVKCPSMPDTYYI